MEHKITLKKQLASLTSFFVLLVFGTIVTLSVYYKIDSYIWIYLVTVFSLLLILVIVIHVQYLRANAGFKLIIYDENKLLCHNKYIEIDLTQDTIAHIEKNISNTFSGSSGHLPTDEYHYSKIFLKSGDTIIITSLLIDDFKFFNDKTKIKKRFIAFIK